MNINRSYECIFKTKYTIYTCIKKDIDYEINKKMWLKLEERIDSVLYRCIYCIKTTLREKDNETNIKK